VAELKELLAMATAERDRLRAALAVTRAALEEIRAYEHFPYATIAISALKRAANVAADHAEPEVRPL
jgi:hypothetical protein